VNSILTLRKELDEHKISAYELTKHYLDKIKNYDTKLHSYITVCEYEALEKAKAVQDKIMSENSAMLCGIPLSVKDNICTKGIRTTCASKMLTDFVPSYDATAVSKIKNSDAIILRKTNMDEFAMGSENETSYFGPVKNPHNTKFTSGGSSGGAAAGVAAGLCIAALATDTGGSIRQPAAFCGVTGIKPTYGSISRYGLIPFASSLDQIGIIANSSKDCAYLINVVSGRDEKDMTSSIYANYNYTSQLGQSLKGLKIGIIKEFFDNYVSDEVKTHFWATIDFYTKNGAIIIDCSSKTLDLSAEIYRIISSAEASSNLSRFDSIAYGHCANSENNEDIISKSRNEGFGEEVKKRILFGNFCLSSDNYENYYKKACGLRLQLKSEFDDIFNCCDVIMSPTTPTSAYLCDYSDEVIRHNYTADKCTVFANLVGIPSITTVCGYDKNSMPIGISISARAYNDAKILGVADAFENEFTKKEVRL